MKDIDTCQVRFCDKEKVARLLEDRADDQTVISLAETFQVLSDPTRLRICMFLSQTELCVCDLSALLSVSESAVSHQLRILRSLRLVKFRRQGKMAFYSLDDAHVDALIRQAHDHIEERKG